MNSVVVTGIGAVSPMGDAASLGSWLRDPRPVKEHHDAMLPPRLGVFRQRRIADLPRPDDISPLSYRRLDRTGRMLLLSAREALAWGNLDAATSSGEIAVSIGAGGSGTTTTGELFECIARDGEEAASPFLFPNTVPNAAAGQLGIALGLSGPSVTVAGNIVAGEIAILEAVETVRRGDARYALTGSVSEGNRYYGTVLWLMKCLAREGEPAGPHEQDSKGARLGEGCGVLLLESEASARERGVAVLARIDGGVESGAPLPPGEVAGSTGSMSRDLQQLSGGAPDWWCVSASGVPRLDACERAILDGTASQWARSPRRTIHDGTGFLIAGGGLRAVAAVQSVAGGSLPARALSPVGAPAEENGNRAMHSSGVITVADGGELVALRFSKLDSGSEGESS